MNGVMLFNVYRGGDKNRAKKKWRHFYGNTLYVALIDPDIVDMLAKLAK